MVQITAECVYNAIFVARISRKVSCEQIIMTISVDRTGFFDTLCGLKN